MPVSTINRVNDALLALQTMFVCIPRLAGLVRSAVKVQDNSKATAHAILLAHHLYHSPNNDFVDQVLAAESTCHQTTFNLMPPIDGIQSFQFPSLAAFVLATKYYTYQTLLCGLIQTLCSANLASGTFDEEEVQARDVSAATAIAMCVEYALGPPGPHPIVAMRLFLPMQMAFGTWHRLERAVSRKDILIKSIYDKAGALKDWTIGIARMLDHMWATFPTDHRGMEKTVEMFAGGPLRNHLGGQE